ncbi:MAG: radical SAM protein [Deltaproteobacteria bacterium]|nr:radical SAM protein [Deltaproteobacteria bacterium]MBW2051053.1 radical SAM protein [Deltaproteobacteria bacterium]MBW2140956.1 radical SAM protein [Deltaproteobacteria bacterium]MBW2323198.1 radical SAM protein [Deltaproteobacteria bacterium]
MNQPMESKSYKYIFGPVPSRRLGQSLGVDLVPFKTCSYDCVYCRLGRTTHKTVERKEYVPTDQILRELEEWLSEGRQANFITLTGSGDPPLHSKCGEIIQAIKNLTDIPVAVIHNGSLLWAPSVREDLSLADLLIVSLDAGEASSFEKVNRPQSDISYDNMLEGLIKFSNGFKGKIWLEVLLLGGITATEAEVAKIAAHTSRIKPYRVQLKIVTSLPSDNWSYPLPETEMLRLVKMFGETTEIIADFGGVREKMEFSVRMEDVLSLLKRRSCNLGEISIALGMHLRETEKYLDLLLRQGVITCGEKGDNLYYISLE